MKLRSDRARQKFADVMIILSNKKIREVLLMKPVIFKGVHITRRELLDLLLSN